MFYKKLCFKSPKKFLSVKNKILENCTVYMNGVCLFERSSISVNYDIVATAGTFIRVIYDPEREGEEAGSHATLMKVKSQVL